MRFAVTLLVCLAVTGGVLAQEGEVAAEAKPAADAQSALERLKLPGIKINLAERSVDVASEVCLDHGTLEFVACKKDSKEHESIVTIDAFETTASCPIPSSSS